MSPDDPGLHADVEPVVGAWLRHLPEPPPSLVGDVMRRVPTTAQRRRHRWPLHRVLRLWKLQQPALATLRLTAVAAVIIGVVLLTRATWPMTRVEQLAAQHGLVVTQTVEPSVVQVLRDDAGHDLMATWPDHPRDIDRLAVGPDGAVWISATARASDNAHLVGAQVWRLGAPGIWGSDDGVPRSVSDLATGPDGSLWVAGTGLSSFRGGTWLPAMTDDRSALVADAADDGSVWVLGAADERAQVWRLAGGRWHDRSDDVALAPFLRGNQARAVATTSDGTTWLGLFAGGGGGAGLLRGAGDGWELVRPLGAEGEDASHDVFALSTGPDGSLWAFLDSPFYGTSTDFRLARWDGAAWRTWTYADGFPADASPWPAPTSALRVGPDGTAWLARQGGGLVAFDGRSAARYLEGVGINDFAIAPDGTVWVAAERAADGSGGVYAILP